MQHLINYLNRTGFAGGLKRGLAAVRAGLPLPWHRSSGRLDQPVQ
jgi:hypothetical protein